jgi:hypothetical protein
MSVMMTFSDNALHAYLYFSVLRSSMDGEEIHNQRRESLKKPVHASGAILRVFKGAGASCSP